MPLPLIAILLNLVTFGGYIYQLLHQSSSTYLLGIVFQALMTGVFLFVMFRYYQREYVNKPQGYRYPTIRFSAIMLSFLINAIVLVLFILNLVGVTQIVFTGY